MSSVFLIFGPQKHDLNKKAYDFFLIFAKNPRERAVLTEETVFPLKTGLFIYARVPSGNGHSEISKPDYFPR